MDRSAQFRSGSSLHRDEEASHSVSQARPRPAIRLDASLSFLNANSRAGSARSGPASPLLSLQPQHDGTRGIHTNAAPNLFATRDVNLDGSCSNSRGSRKPQRMERRDGCRSAVSPSLSLSLGSSRPRSEHRLAQRPATPSLSQSSRGVAATASVDAVFSCAPLSADAMLESEPTLLTRPSEPRAEGSVEAVLGTVFSQSSAQRTASPAPRMAVALPDDFDCVFSPSISPVPSEPRGGKHAAPQMTLPVSASAVTAMPAGGGGALRAESTSDFSSFSFCPGENAAAEEEEGDGRRTQSGTPPPRRAFVLSRRGSAVAGAEADSVVASERRDDGDTASHDAPTAVRTATGVCAGGAVVEEEATSAAVPASAAVEEPRGSVLLVTGDGSIGFRAAAADAAAAGVVAGQRSAYRWGRGRYSRSPRNEPESAVAAVAEAGESHDKNNEEEVPAETTGALVVEAPTPGAAVAVRTGEAEEEKKAQDGLLADAEEGEVDQVPPPPAVPQPDTLMSATHNAISTVTPQTTDASDGALRLSDHISYSGHSSIMMSPLPRPVSAFADAVRGEAAVARHRAAQLSAAHPREDEAVTGTHAAETPMTTATMHAEVTEDVAAGVEGVEEVEAVATAPSDASTSAPAVKQESPSSFSPSALSGGDAEVAAVAVAPLDSIFDNSAVSASLTADAHAFPAASGRGGDGGEAEVDGVTASTLLATTVTSSTAVSSLWLVSGSTPTPLRRLRGDGDDDGDDGDAGNDGASAAVEAETEGTATATMSRALSASQDRAEAGKEESVIFSQQHGDTPQQTRAGLLSRSPEPLRPETAAMALTASISPISSVDRPQPRHRYDHPYQQRQGEGEVVEAHTSRQCNAVATTSNSDELRLLLTSSRSTAAGTPVAAPRTAPSPHSITPHAQQARRAEVLTPQSPSSTTPLRDSARVSEEVRELVERVQAEVRRSRASLLSTLRDHRTEFRLRESSPTTPSSLPVPAAAATVGVANTPSRALQLPTQADSPSPANSTTAPTATARTSAELRSAATALRPQLAAAADAIERRLRGYDGREHGVLPMETVVRVTHFVLTRRSLPVAEWALRPTVGGGGGGGATPMRASMLDKESRSALRQHHYDRCYPRSDRVDKNEEEEEERMETRAEKHRHATAEDGTRMMSGGRGRAGVQNTPSSPPPPSRFQTPRAQRLSPATGGFKRTRDDTTAVFSTERTHAVRGGDVEHDEEEEESRETTGRPATRMSPTRTLESVMSRQEQRAEEAQRLSFYLTIVEAFKQVFGERYAWRHLGATNASRHDYACSKRAKVEGEAGGGGGGARVSGAGHGGSAAAQAIASMPPDGENELNDVAGPLETVFPRLRQHYALHHTGDGSAGLALRPPPLDVLVYYRTYTASLREL